MESRERVSYHTTNSDRLRFALHTLSKYIMAGHLICPVPSWLSWLERQSHNLKVVSSSLTEGKIFW